MTEDAAIIDPLMHGLRSKGLKKGSVSLVGAVAIGLAATAPAYSLTGALGHGASESGYQLPIVFIIAVIPPRWPCPRRPPARRHRLVAAA
jgi:hypothetical protein